MVDPDGISDVTQGCEASVDWMPVPGSGWSVEELEALVRIGVPVVNIDADADTDTGATATADAGRTAGVVGWDEGQQEAGRSWIDEVEHPEHGPVSWLAQRVPSGALLSDLESLPVDLVEDDYDSVEMVALWAKLESYCAAGKRFAAAAMARRESLANGLAHLAAMGIEAGEVSVAADELSVRLGISKPAAGRLVRSGRAMNEVGIPTGDALAGGEIDAVKADLILEAVKDLGAGTALGVQERVLPKARHMSTGQLRREVAAACAAVDPDRFEDRCAHAAQSRRVGRPRALPHGMASLYAVMPAVEATQLYRAVDAAARSGKAAGDRRTMDQLRADALAAMGLAAVHSGWIGPAPTGHPQAPPRGGDDTVPETSEPGNNGEPGSVGEPADEARVRVGHIGGASAHVRVVVPYTVLMDDPPDGTGPEATPEAPDAAHAPATVNDIAADRRSNRHRQRRRGDPEHQTHPEHQSHHQRGSHREHGNDHLHHQAERSTICPDGSDDPVTASSDPAGSSDDLAASCAGAEAASGMAGEPVASSRGQVPTSGDPVTCSDDADSCPDGRPGCSMVCDDGPAEALDRSDASTDGLPARQQSVPDQLTIPFLEGYGPIPAAAARAVAAGSTWSRLVLDPIDRTVLEVSATTYRPPESMARLVRAAQPYCAGPTCSVSADSCDLNHRIPYPVGATSVWNIDPECRRDHLLITHGGWRYEQDNQPGGPRTWITPTGHAYHQQPDGKVTMAPRSTPTPTPSDDTPPPF